MLEVITLKKNQLSILWFSIGFFVMEEALNTNLENHYFDSQVCRVLDNDTFGIEPKSYKHFKYAVVAIITIIFLAFVVWFKPKEGLQELGTASLDVPNRRISIIRATKTKQAIFTKNKVSNLGIHF